MIRDPQTPHSQRSALWPTRHGVDLPIFQQVQTPEAARHLAWLAFGLFCAATVGLIVIPWQQTSTGSGRVIAYAPLERQQTVEAPIEGRIRHWHVHEGSHVLKGQPLVEISDNDPQLLERLQDERRALEQRLEAAQARMEALDRRLTEQDSSRLHALDGADRRVKMALDRETAAVQAQQAAEAAQRTAKLNVDRQDAMQAHGLASTRQQELAALEEQKTRTDLNRAEAAVRAARHEVHSLQADARRVGNDFNAVLEDVRASRASALSEVANARAELARLGVRLSRQEAQSVTAPRAGTVLRLMANQDGEMVKAGDGLAVLVPDTKARAVEVWVKGNDVPLVRVGRKVRLQFEGWPALQFSGWPQAAVGTFGGQVALIDATDNGAGEFRVVVVPDATEEPWPEAGYLRQGVRAHSWILLNRVPLWYELWRQFNGFPPTISQKPDGDKDPSPLGPVKAGKG